MRRYDRHAALVISPPLTAAGFDVETAATAAEAKRLGVPYDPASEPKITTQGGPEGPKQVGVSSEAPAVKQALNELYPTTNFRRKIETAGKDYGLTYIYTGTSFMTGPTPPSKYCLILDSLPSKM